MLKTIQFLVVFITFTCLNYGQAVREYSFTFSDGQGGSKTLVAGIDPSATDGIDVSLGEQYVPPFPPSGFDVHFILPGTSTDYVYKDIRNGDTTAAFEGTELVHTVSAQLGSGSSGLHISWDLPAGVGLNLQDNITHSLFNVNYSSGANEYTVPFSLTTLLLTIKYVVHPFPVELTSFSGKFLNNKVELNWKTATEVNNYGFEVQRLEINKISEWKKIGFVQGHGNSNSPKEYSFIDNNLNGSGKFQYRLKQIDNNGEYEYSSVLEVAVKPNTFDLLQNYPNPFNPVTNFEFRIVQPGFVSLKIYDVLGNIVATIINKELESGYYKYQWDASRFSSGIYFYRLQTGKITSTKKLVLTK